MGLGREDEEEEMGATATAAATGGSRCEWHPATVACLLDRYGDKCAHIKGYLKVRDWEDIVRNVNAHDGHGRTTPKTMKQCRDKVENLKRRYKLEKRRADARGPGAVTWSFFHKLDHIMTSLNRTGNLLEAGEDEGEGDDAANSHSQSYDGMECELPEGFAGESMPVPGHVPLPAMSMSDMVLSAFKGGTAGGSLDNVDCVLDDILNGVAYNRISRLDFQDSSSPEKKPPKRKKPPSSNSSSPFSKKRKAAAKPPASANPVQSLADALAGFSEVYARIEIAKMEMFTKLILELAKLHSKKRKKSESASTPPDPTQRNVH